MSSGDMEPGEAFHQRWLNSLPGRPVEHRHMLVTIYRRRWQDLFRASHEIRCWTCPLVVREPR